MDHRLAPVALTFLSNTAVFRGTTKDMTESAWLHRAGEANHIAYLAMHLIGARHFTIGWLGGESTDPFEKYHNRGRSIDDTERFPTIDEAISAWDEVAPFLLEALDEVDGAVLDEDSGLPFPAPGPLKLDTLIFLAQHEAYHLGQMGLLRRVAGLAATEWR